MVIFLDIVEFLAILAVKVFLILIGLSILAVVPGDIGFIRCVVGIMMLTISGSISRGDG